MRSHSQKVRPSPPNALHAPEFPAFANHIQNTGPSTPLDSDMQVVVK